MVEERCIGGLLGPRRVLLGVTPPAFIVHGPINEGFRFALR